MIRKGDRIRAQWLATHLCALAGAQMKFGAHGRELTGTVRHVRGDHPVNPTVVKLYVDPEGDFDGPKTTPYGCTCDHPHVEVDPSWVAEVL